MKSALCGFIVLFALLAAGSVRALEPMVPYDDFNEPLIDPKKWVGSEFGQDGRELVREIKGGRLRLLYRAYGNTGFDSGIRDPRARVAFANPRAVTAIEATVRVTRAEATGCAVNPDSTWVRARVGGYFFNFAPTGSATNDVIAQIFIERRSDSIDPPKVLRVRASVVRCTDPGCNTVTDLVPSHDLGPIRRGQRARLRVEWDQDNHQFLFQRDSDPEVSSSYTVSDTNPSFTQFKRLDIAIDVANCTAAPRPVGFMEAFFEDIFVNQSAAP